MPIHTRVPSIAAARPRPPAAAPSAALPQRSPAVGAGHELARISVRAPAREGVVQRVKLKNAEGVPVDVSEDKITTALHQLMFDTMVNDTRDHPPLPSGLGLLNAPYGGQPRSMTNIDDTYNVVRELKQRPPNLLELQHGGGISNQIGITTSSQAKEGDTHKVQDVVVRPKETPDEFEGHRYSQIGTSMQSMATERSRKKRKLTPSDIAADHIRLMKGKAAEGGRRPTDEQKERMWYNNSIMFAAEGKRNVGMLPFSYMTLHNLKHSGTIGGKTGLTDVFGIEGKKAKDDTPGNHPAAFSGSKAGLVEMEGGLYSGKTPSKVVKGLQGTDEKSARKVRTNMNTQVSNFFQGKWADLSRDKYKNFQSAGFTTEDEAVQAAVDIVRHKFLKRITGVSPPIPRPPPPPPTTPVVAPDPDSSKKRKRSSSNPTPKKKKKTTN